LRHKKFHGSEIAARALAKANSGGSYGNGPDGWVAKIPLYAGERPTPGGVNDLRRTGRAIVYQLINKDGNTDPRTSFDLALFWKDYIDYDKLTLDYDTFDPNGDLTCQIVLEMPEVPPSFEVSFAYNIETTYNGELQAKNEILEILPDD